MACGLPAVISSDEVYADALLAAGVCQGAARNVAAIASALTAALSTSPAERQRARAWAESEWSLDRMAERYLGLLGKLRAGV
jgi:glycosyltransferase involved in cell wall biosynthesis